MPIVNTAPKVTHGHLSSNFHFRCFDIFLMKIQKSKSKQITWKNLIEILIYVFEKSRFEPKQFIQLSSDCDSGKSYENGF